MKNFAIIGVAGYIAPRHLKAIKETKNSLLAAMDINDSVGLLDSHFSDADFAEFEEFSEFVEDQRLNGVKLDYIVVHAHQTICVMPHIKFALKNGIDVICEKPLALRKEHLVELKNYEKFYGAKVYTILQLRLHPTIVELRQKLSLMPQNEPLEIELTYLTSRGKWYDRESWKGDLAKSGGVAANIGIHF